MAESLFRFTKKRREEGVEMVEQLQALTDQMVIFATLIFIGIFTVKTKLLSSENIDHVSAILLRLILPLMLLTVIGSGSSRAQFFSMGPFFLCAMAQYLICLFLGWASAVVFRIKEPTKGIHTAVAGIGNSGFIGFPLLIAMFPKQAPVAIAVYVVVDSGVIWTLCPILANPAPVKQINFRRFVTPATIAVVLGILIVILDWKPSGLAWKTMTDIGATSKYFALLYIGGDIGRKGLKKLFARPIIFSVLPVRLILCPLVVFLFFRITGFLSMEYAVMLSVLSMTPSMIVISMLARTYGSDEEYASGAIMLTSLAGILTMPCMMWLFTKLS